MRAQVVIPIITSILILGLFGFSQDAIADPAVLLIITTQPTNTGVNSPITVVVEARDAFGIPDPTFGGDVSVSIGTDPSGGTATLSGTLTVSAINGIATFNDLSIDVVANGYTLSFSSVGIVPTTSNLFDVQITTLPVDIDIKPGSDPNSINTKSMGKVPVAILGSDTFDVTDVDVTTLAFGPSGATPIHDLTDPVVYASHLEDVNNDGFTDLVSHYVQKETGLLSGDIEACITGQTTGGTPIEGCDSVKVK